MTAVRISVCMATYNGEKFINEQLQSILEQLGPSDEIIISDDSSQDNTTSFVRAFNDSRIRLLENQQVRSAISNFENALKHARGEYIFLADQDDVWYRDKISVFLQELQSADLVVSDCTFIDESGKIIGDSYFKAYKSGSGFIKNFVKNTYLGNCMAFRRAVLLKALPFPKVLYQASKFLVYQDAWIGLVANLVFQVRFIPIKLSAYRRHSHNASPTGMDAKSPNSLVQKIKARSLLALGLLGRVAKKY